MKNIFHSLKFDQNGLIPAIAQDYESGQVLMMAFMNKEAVIQSLKTDIAHYFSRSRQKLWKKGETSGNVQEIKKILLDCDGDTILLQVKQKGKFGAIACHTGRKSCFFYDVASDGALTINQDILANEEDLYGKK